MISLAQAVIQVLVSVKLATANDAKYLRALNLQALQKTRGKPAPGENPKDFYMALQREAEQGPLFNADTLSFFDKIEIELQKNEIQWLANCFQTDAARIRVEDLPSLLDYIRAENPDLSKLKYMTARLESRRWHQQFKGKEESSGPYTSKNVVLKLPGNYCWVEVPVNDLKTEGDLMGHCVGENAHYAKGIKKKNTQILSLRDAGNKPHVTIEYLVKKRRVAQIQGKENKEPIEKYHRAIETLLEHLNVKHDQITFNYVTNEAKLTDIAKKGSIKDREDLAHYHDRLPDSILEILARDKSEEVRCAICRRESIPASVLTRLAKDKSDIVRMRLTGHVNLPSELLHKLAQDSSAEVRRGVALHTKLSPATMNILVEDPDQGVIRTLAEHKNLPVALMPKIAKHPNEYIRGAVAEREDAPVDLLTTLALDKTTTVKARVAENPSTPSKVLTRFLNSNPVAEVRMGAAINPNLPVEFMNGLAKDSYLSVRVYLTQNPNLSEEAAVILSKDTDETVRAKLAARCSCLPKEVQQKLLKEKGEVKIYMVMNKSLDHDLMRAIIDGNDIAAREHLALNEGLPLDIIKELSEDADKDVIINLLDNPSVPDEIKRRIEE